LSIERVCLSLKEKSVMNFMSRFRPGQRVVAPSSGCATGRFDAVVVDTKGDRRQVQRVDDGGREWCYVRDLQYASDEEYESSSDVDHASDDDYTEQAAPVARRGVQQRADEDKEDEDESAEEEASDEHSKESDDDAEEEITRRRQRRDCAIDGGERVGAIDDGCSTLADLHWSARQDLRPVEQPVGQRTLPPAPLTRTVTRRAATRGASVTRLKGAATQLASRRHSLDVVYQAQTFAALDEPILRHSEGRS
jgi:hypothetical protein